MRNFLKTFSIFFTLAALTAATLIFSSLIYSVFGIFWSLLFMTFMIGFMFTFTFSLPDNYF